VKEEESGEKKKKKKKFKKLEVAPKQTELESFSIKLQK
jgi:hypothetical protein